MKWARKQFAHTVKVRVALLRTYPIFQTMDDVCKLPYQAEPSQGRQPWEWETSSPSYRSVGMDLWSTPRPCIAGFYKGDGKGVTTFAGQTCASAPQQVVANPSQRFIRR
eukprot:scaffold487580_cov26-Prasinocladus_malaysianus.AAC.1